LKRRKKKEPSNKCLDELRVAIVKIKISMKKMRA